MIGRVTNMGGNQAGKPGLEVSTRLLGSHIQFRDGSTTRLDANHIAKKLFREGRTGTIHDLSDMLSGYYRQPGTTPEALVGAAAAAEARERGTSTEKATLDVAFAPGAFSFRANEGMKDVERIDFEVEFTVRSRT
jgi:hypothetical protein